MSPVFAAATTDYAIAVANTVTSLTISGVKADAGASVPSPTVLNDLVAGIARTATIKVTAEDGKASKTYTFVVTRAASNPANADLRGITLTAGTLRPAFAAGTTSYTVNVDSSVTSVTVTGLIADTASSVSAPVVLNGLTVGVPQTATLTVTSGNLTTKSYAVAVTQTSTDPKLMLRSLSKPAKISSGAASNQLEEANVGTATDVGDDYAVEGQTPVKYHVSTQRKTASADYDQCNLLKPDSGVIYPGSVLLGSSIDDGTYVEVTSGVKKPVTLSYSLVGVTAIGGGPGVISKTFIPTSSGTRDFQNEVMSQNVPGQSIPAFQFESTEVNNEEALNLKITAGATYTGVVKASVEAGFDYSATNHKNKILVRFSQTFYTVDLDQAGDKFLYESIDLDSFGGYRPVYVSSVAYGRVGFLSVETSLSQTDFKATLAVACNTGSLDVNTAMEAAKTKLNTTSTIKITLIGGNTSPTTLDSFMTEIRDGGFSPTNRGVPVAYQLRFVDDNTIANTKFIGEYTSRQVTAYTGFYRVGIRLANIYGTDAESGGMEIYGNVRVKKGDNNSSDTQELFMNGSGYYTNGNSYNFADGWSGYSGPTRTYDFLSDMDSFTIASSGMREDDTTGDDGIDDANVTKQVSSILGGAAFDLRANFSASSGQYLIFNIVPTVEILYSGTPRI